MSWFKRIHENIEKEISAQDLKSSLRDEDVPIKILDFNFYKHPYVSFKQQLGSYSQEQNTEQFLVSDIYELSVLPYYVDNPEESVHSEYDYKSYTHWIATEHGNMDAYFTESEKILSIFNDVREESYHKGFTTGVNSLGVLFEDQSTGIVYVGSIFLENHNYSDVMELVMENTTYDEENNEYTTEEFTASLNEDQLIFNDKSVSMPLTYSLSWNSSVFLDYLLPNIPEGVYDIFDKFAASETDWITCEAEIDTEPVSIKDKLLLNLDYIGSFGFSWSPSVHQDESVTRFLSDLDEESSGTVTVQVKPYMEDGLPENIEKHAYPDSTNTWIIRPT